MQSTSATIERCPSSFELEAFLAGELPEAEDASVARHLQGCTICDKVAFALSDDPEARRLLAARAADDPEDSSHSLGELQGRMAALAMLPAKTVGRAGSTSASRGSAADTEPGEHVSESAVLRRTLGKFEIHYPLGTGAFGVVYLATDTVLKRKVALKLPRLSVLADPDLRRRLSREASALARLDHPGIIPVYEAGDCDGTCYLAVGYCEGSTLDRWLAERRSPVEPKQAARMALALAEAVEHAHRQGILHRDIKPSNVLLDGVPAAGELPAVKLTDFGLAKLSDEQQQQATLSGMILGTPQYMAPEQAAGMSDRVGPATDVYALGAVLYEMLTGRPPIQGHNSADTLRRVLVDDPERPQRMQPQVPADLDAIVMKCLEKAAVRRYATAGELADELRRFLDGRTTRARPQHLAERAVRWARRNPGATSVAGLVAAMFLMAAGLFAYDRRLRESDKQAKLNSEQIATLAYANGIVSAAQAVNDKDLAQAAAILSEHVPRPGQNDVRGLEWHYLSAVTSPEPVAEVDAGSSIYQVRVSPDGQTIAAACADGELRLYDARTLKQLRTTTAKVGEINGLGFYPDGRFLYVAGDSGEIRTVGVGLDQRWRSPFKAHPGKAYNVIHLGETWVTCGDDPTIRVWTRADRLVAQLEGHTGDVEAIAVSPDGALLASGGDDMLTVLWDLKTNQSLWAIQRHDRRVAALSFSPDGKRLATAGHDAIVQVCDVKTGETLYWAEHADPVQAVTFVGDGSRLVSADRGGAIRVWNVPLHDLPGKPELLQPVPDDAFQAHDGVVYSLAALPNGIGFISAGRDGKLRRWQRGDYGSVRRKILPAKQVWEHCAISGDGKLVYVLRPMGAISVLDAATGRAIGKFSAPQQKLMSIALLEDRGQIAAGTDSGQIVLWDINTRKIIHLWTIGDSEWVSPLVYSSAAGLLAFGSDARHGVPLIDVRTGVVTRVLPAAPGVASALAISPDGERIAFSSDNDIVIHDLRRQRRLQQWRAHASSIHGLDFSPDGQYLASGSNDRTVKIWTADGSLLASLHGHRQMVRLVQFTADGKSLLSGDAGGTIRAANVPTFLHLMEIPTATQNLRDLAIFPDSRRLAMVADDGLLLVGTAPDIAPGNDK